MNDDPDNPIPERGKFAKVHLTAALDDCQAPGDVPFPPGVYIGRPNVVILSHGERATVLRLESADDAGRLAVGLLALAQIMEAEAALATAAANTGLAKVLAEREAAGHA